MMQAWADYLDSLKRDQDAKNSKVSVELEAAESVRTCGVQSGSSDNAVLVVRLLAAQNPDQCHAGDNNEAVAIPRRRNLR